MLKLKYKLDPTDTKIVNGVTVTRIVALRDFGNFNAGEKGGYIEKESNLSQEDDCWVYLNATVFGNARVYGDSWVYGNAKVFGEAQVSGDAYVSGNAQVSGNAKVYGDAYVYGYAQVSGDAKVYGELISNKELNINKSSISEELSYDDLVLLVKKQKKKIKKLKAAIKLISETK